MAVTLSMISELEPERVHELTVDLCRTINAETEIAAQLPASEGPAEGNKGDVVTIGTIVLALIGSGGVAASLIGVLKSYVERDRTFAVELKRPDGTKLKLNSENLSSDQMDKTVKLVKDFAG